jgi:molybdopterin-guanine dinucleotide biosynthesis protein A
MTPGGAVPSAGIVLAGGRSARMGAQKAWLEWEGSTLLRNRTDTLATVTDLVVVVRAVGQELPCLPPEVMIVDDAHPDRGPLQGLASGLRALDLDSVAFVCAVDTPLLGASFAAAVLASLSPAAAAAVPRVDGRPQPLAGAYRAGIAETIEGLLASGRRSMRDLLDALEVRWLDDLPGAADALRNVNTPAELEAARQASREKATTEPAAPSSSSPTHASAVAPASEVIAWGP